VLRAGEQALEGGVSGEDSHRQGDLILLCAPKWPLAVPAIGEEREEPRHRLRKPHPVGERLRHFRERGEVRALRGIILGSRRTVCTIRTGPGRCGSGSAREPRDDLALRPVDDGIEMGGERIPEHLRGHVGISRAARVREQAGVVALRGR
jgi:hypothetical protein